jgi:hypothetical protein
MGIRQLALVVRLKRKVQKTPFTVAIVGLPSGGAGLGVVFAKRGGVFFGSL